MKCFPIAFPTIFGILYSSSLRLPLYYSSSSLPVKVCPEFSHFPIYSPCVLLTTPSLKIPLCPHPWSLFTFLICLVIRGHILASKDSEQGKWERICDVRLSGSRLPHSVYFLVSFIYLKIVGFHFFTAEQYFHCASIPHFHSPFISWLIRRLFLPPDSCEWSNNEHGCQVSVEQDVQSFMHMARAGMVSPYLRPISRFLKGLHTDFHSFWTSLQKPSTNYEWGIPFSTLSPEFVLRCFLTLANLVEVRLTISKWF